MKPRIAISQRVDVVPAYGERRDALDQSWARLLGSLGALCVPMPNAPELTPDWLTAIRPDGIILSGGNDLASLGESKSVAAERDQHERLVIEWAAANGRPLLGVCRGMQMLNVHLGGQLVRVPGHVASRHRVMFRDENPAAGGARSVNSYHNWAITAEGLASDLVEMALADDGTIEAVRHRTLPWQAIMWHPEREAAFAPADVKLLESLFTFHR